MLGIDPVKLAKAEIKKLDVNHNGVPDAIEALEVAEKACEALAIFVGSLDAEDAEAVLNFINSLLKNKRSDVEIKAAAAALVEVPAALRKAKAVLESAEAEIKK